MYKEFWSQQSLIYEVHLYNHGHYEMYIGQGFNITHRYGSPARNIIKQFFYLLHAIVV